MNYLKSFSTICDRHKLKVVHQKAMYSTGWMKWCSSIIDKHGYQLDTKSMEAEITYMYTSLMMKFAIYYTVLNGRLTTTQI